MLAAFFLRTIEESVETMCHGVNRINNIRYVCGMLQEILQRLFIYSSSQGQSAQFSLKRSKYFTKLFARPRCGVTPTIRRSISREL